MKSILRQIDRPMCILFYTYYGWMCAIVVWLFLEVGIIGIVHCYGSTRGRQEKKEEEEIKDGGVIDILVYYYIMKYVRLITRWFPAPSSLRY